MGSSTDCSMGNHADKSIDLDTDSGLGELGQVLDWTGLV
jgi:hypothetical protein